MHDSRGNPLKEGDTVLIEARVTQCSPDDAGGYCNCMVQVVTPYQANPPAMTPPSISAINTRMLTKIGAILVLLAAAAASLTPDATACNRCGIFGRGCRVAAYHAPAHVAVAAAPSVQQTQNFIFNNAFPATPLAGQGSSLYGYSLAAQAEAPSRALILSQAARLTENAQTLAGQGLNGFSALVQTELAGQNEVAKTLAQGHAATSALLAAKGADTQATATTFSFQASVGGDGKLTVTPIAAAANDDYAAIIQARCVSCHSGDKPKKGFDLSQPQTLNLAAWEHIAARIETTDPAAVMPRTADGKGAPLGLDERAALLCRYLEVKRAAK